MRVPLILLCLLLLAHCTSVKSGVGANLLDNQTVQALMPKATRSERAGIVISPFWPHRLIDVAGIAPGTIASDPLTRSQFLVP